MALLTVNGARLNLNQAGEGTPLLLLHGFTGSAATWRPLMAALGGRRTLAVDLLGHGESDAPNDPERYQADRCVEDVTAVLDALHVEEADVLGYSMGARVALHFAAAQAERVGALVLESGSPGIDDPDERARRVAADEQLAQIVEREGVEAFIDRWERLPLWASQASLPAERRAGLRAQRLRNRAVGLAGSLRGLGQGVQPPLWEALPHLQAPTLLIAGALDAKYRDLAHAMAARVPNARAEIVPAAGHAVHFEQPERFTEIVRGFLDEHPLLGETTPHPDPLPLEREIKLGAAT